jgi:DNA-binding response OmpR family regulator
MRVLLVEDARRMSDAIAAVLRRNHYSVDCCCDGQQGLDFALADIYDVIILDIMLPKRDGLSVLAELRRQQIATPVLLLTAKSQTEDKVCGLDCGADYYLTKPFEMDELLACLRALVRRPGEVLPSDCICLGGTELSPHSLKLRCNRQGGRGDGQGAGGAGGAEGIGSEQGTASRQGAQGGGQSCTLTLKEAQLLELLMRNHGITLSPQTIINKVWGFDAQAEDRHVQVYISFLRKRLSQLKADIQIKTIRGIGYMLTVCGDAGEPDG